LPRRACCRLLSARLQRRGCRRTFEQTNEFAAFHSIIVGSGERRGRHGAAEGFADSFLAHITVMLLSEGAACSFTQC